MDNPPPRLTMNRKAGLNRLKWLLLLVVVLLLSDWRLVGNATQPQAVPPDAGQDEYRQIEVEYVQLYRKKDYKKALLLAKQVLAAREEKLGPDHLLVGHTLANMASILAALNKFEDSEALLKRVIAIRQQQLGHNHPDVIATLEQYACFLWTRKKDGEADEIEREIERRLYPDEALTLSESLTKGKSIKRVSPEYPEKLLRALVSGVVVVKVVIDEQGEVTDAFARCGHELFVQASLKAARAWKFKPSLMDGKPVKIRGRIVFHFDCWRPGMPPPYTP